MKLLRTSALGLSFCLVLLPGLLPRLLQELSPAALAATNPRTEEADPIFWQIDAQPLDGSAKAGRLYLLGSIHVGPVGGWQLPQSILDRFKSASALIVEVDMRAGSPEAQDDAVMRHGLLPPGESIKNHISPALYKALGQQLTKSNRLLVNINPWQPWMVATMLLGYELERLGYPTQAGLDLDMLARLTDRQRVIGLETMDEQLSLLSGLSSANQELMLKDMLLQTTDIENYFNELKEAWRRGDESKLEEVLFRELQANPELAPFYESVIYGRSQSMCEHLQKDLASGETLFGVVGAYHLVGSRGIPACLARHGNRVVRLREPSSPTRIN